MDLNSLFTPDSIAAYVIGVATGLAALIAQWIRGRRGNRVVVSLLSQSPQVSISESVSNNLEIKYKGQPVDQIVLTRLVITNEGAIDIKDLALKLHVRVKQFNDKKASTLPFVEAILSDPLALAQIDTTRIDTGLVTPELPSSMAWEIDFRRPFFNPKRAYKEEQIGLTLISNATIDVSVKGGGPGWYTQYKVSVSVRDGITFSITGILLISIAAILLDSVGRIFGFLPASALSMVLVVAALVSFVSFLFYGFRFMNSGGYELLL
jgi:hypothetical protein